MDTSSLENLVQASLDGALSVTERAELARLLLRDPDARRLHHEFLQTDRLLREIPRADSPPGLRADILAARALSSRPVGPGHRQFGRPHYRAAAAVLGGLLIVGIGYLWRDGGAPATDLQGSLDSGAPRDHWSVRSESVEIDASLSGNSQRQRLELDVSTAIPCEVIAHIDPAKTALVGNSGGARLTAANDQVSVRLPAGKRVFALEFSGAAPIRLQLRAGGRLLAEGSLSATDP